MPVLVRKSIGYLVVAPCYDQDDNKCRLHRRKGLDTPYFLNMKYTANTRKQKPMR